MKSSKHSTHLKTRVRFRSTASRVPAKRKSICRPSAGRSTTDARQLFSSPKSLEIYHNAAIGKYRLVWLTQRGDQKQMPLIRVVDLRQERRKEKKAAILSEKLSQAIADRLEKREQTILFLNRRGFSTSLLCGECGEARNCPNFSVWLTFHRHPSVAGRLSCHF